MPSYDDNALDEVQSLEHETGKGPRLPGGISVQTAAAALLIVVVVAVLWLLAAPDAEAPPDLATATSAAVGGAVASAPPVTGTLATGRAAGGTPVSGAAVAAASTSTAMAPTSAPGSGLTAAPPPAAPVTGNLAEGTFVRVSGTGTDGIRFRFGPGLTYATIRIATDGDVMLVLGGPESADTYEWWRLQDELGHVGWAADSFLTPIAAPANWSPPQASPTFESGAEGAAGPVLALPTP